MDAAGGAGNNGFSIAAQALAALGIRHMYGVIGIPVTELASAAQVIHPACLSTISTLAALPSSCKLTIASRGSPLHTKLCKSDLWKADNQALQTTGSKVVTPRQEMVRYSNAALLRG